MSGTNVLLDAPIHSSEEFDENELAKRRTESPNRLGISVNDASGRSRLIHEAKIRHDATEDADLRARYKIMIESAATAEDQDSLEEKYRLDLPDGLDGADELRNVGADSNYFTREQAGMDAWDRTRFDAAFVGSETEDERLARTNMINRNMARRELDYSVAMSASEAEAASLTFSREMRDFPITDAETAAAIRAGHPPPVSQAARERSLHEPSIEEPVDFISGPHLNSSASRANRIMKQMLDSSTDPRGAFSRRFDLEPEPFDAESMLDRTPIARRTPRGTPTISRRPVANVTRPGGRPSGTVETTPIQERVDSIAERREREQSLVTSLKQGPADVVLNSRIETNARNIEALSENERKENLSNALLGLDDEPQTRLKRVFPGDLPAGFTDGVQNGVAYPGGEPEADRVPPTRLSGLWESFTGVASRLSDTFLSVADGATLGAITMRDNGDLLDDDLEFNAEDDTVSRAKTDTELFVRGGRAAIERADIPPPDSDEIPIPASDTSLTAESVAAESVRTSDISDATTLTDTSVDSASIGTPSPLRRDPILTASERTSFDTRPRLPVLTEEEKERDEKEFEAEDTPWEPRMSEAGHVLPDDEIMDLVQENMEDWLERYERSGPITAVQRQELEDMQGLLRETAVRFGLNKVEVGNATWLRTQEIFNENAFPEMTKQQVMVSQAAQEMLRSPRMKRALNIMSDSQRNNADRAFANLVEQHTLEDYDVFASHMSVVLDTYVPPDPDIFQVTSARMVSSFREPTGGPTPGVRIEHPPDPEARPAMGARRRDSVESPPTSDSSSPPGFFSRLSGIAHHGMSSVASRIRRMSTTMSAPDRSIPPVRRSRRKPAGSERVGPPRPELGRRASVSVDRPFAPRLIVPIAGIGGPRRKPKDSVIRASEQREFNRVLTQQYNPEFISGVADEIGRGRQTAETRADRRDLSRWSINLRHLNTFMRGSHTPGQLKLARQHYRVTYQKVINKLGKLSARNPRISNWMRDGAQNAIRDFGHSTRMINEYKKAMGRGSVSGSAKRMGMHLINEYESGHIGREVLLNFMDDVLTRRPSVRQGIKGTNEPITEVKTKIGPSQQQDLGKGVGRRMFSMQPVRKSKMISYPGYSVFYNLRTKQKKQLIEFLKIPGTQLFEIDQASGRLFKTDKMLVGRDYLVQKATGDNVGGAMLSRSGARHRPAIHRILMKDALRGHKYAAPILHQMQGGDLNTGGSAFTGGRCQTFNYKGLGTKIRAGIHNAPEVSGGALETLARAHDENRGLSNGEKQIVGAAFVKDDGAPLMHVDPETHAKCNQYDNSFLNMSKSMDYGMDKHVHNLLRGGGFRKVPRMQIASTTPYYMNSHTHHQIIQDNDSKYRENQGGLFGAGVIRHILRKTGVTGAANSARDALGKPMPFGVRNQF